MIRLSKTDTDLMTTQRTVNLSSDAKVYMGGEFLTNSKDHIQLLIHDENNNFLESFILDDVDYTVVDNGAGPEVRMNTGTILRQNGYDRGRFVLKFLFLRYVAGSDNTLLIKNDRKVFGKTTGEVFDKTNPSDVQRVTGGPGILPDLTIKDNKYWLEEISATRTEVRILPQKIDDDEYINDFFDMQNSRKRLTSINENLPGLQFVGSPRGVVNTGDSKTLFFGGDLSFDSRIVFGGKFFIPNAFITSITPPAPIFELSGLNKEPIERDADANNIGNAVPAQASFFMTDNLIKGDEYAWNYNSSFAPSKTLTQLNLSPGKFGDRYFTGYRTLFERFDKDGPDDPDNAFDVNLAGRDAYTNPHIFEYKDFANTQTPRGITKPKWEQLHTLRPIIVEQNEYVIIEFQSNSTLVRQKEFDDAGNIIGDVLNEDGVTTYTNFPTNYYWTVTGHDWDKNKGSGGKGFQDIRPGAGRDFEIITSQGHLAQVAPEFGFRTVNPNIAQTNTNPFQAVTQNSTNGSSIILKLNSSDLWVGLGLTVEQNTSEGQGKSTVHLPACIWTPHERAT
tara:strand:+ start:1526 stop:3211 length:1686 start_codon:yes stop_codon:yes gene_type:complete